MWYSFFLNSLIFTVSITVRLLEIRKALGEVYVIVVTPVHYRGRLAPPRRAIGPLVSVGAPVQDWLSDEPALRVGLRAAAYAE